jgi:GrpB protein/Sodium/calcium exchanger protein
VVGASTVMEVAATALGRRYAVAGIVTGALVLAVVTSLPNAVTAVYLARKGRGAAVLSTALNSNAINVTAGLLVPASLTGLGPPAGQDMLVAGWYAGLTLLALAYAYRGRGLGRTSGAAIIAGYLAFVSALAVSVMHGHLGPAAVVLPTAIAAGALALMHAAHQAGLIRRGAASLGIHHVGSTAVPGLDAKPVIDILAGIGDLATARPCIGLLAPLCYLCAPYRAGTTSRSCSLPVCRWPGGGCRAWRSGSRPARRGYSGCWEVR